jgi:TonB family protein
MVHCVGIEFRNHGLHTMNRFIRLTTVTLAASALAFNGGFGIAAHCATSSKPSLPSKPDVLSSAVMEEIGFYALRSAIKDLPNGNVQVSPIALFSTLVDLQQSGGQAGSAVKKALTSYGLPASFKPRAYETAVKEMIQSQERFQLDCAASSDTAKPLKSQAVISWPWNEFLDARYETPNSTFYTPESDESISASTFEVLNNLDYLETLEFKAVRLPAKSSPMSLYIFVPHKGVALDLLVTQLTVDNWKRWKRGFSNSIVELQLPRFAFQNKQALVAASLPQEISSAVTAGKGGKGIVSWQTETSLIDRPSAFVTGLNRQLTALKNVSARQPFLFFITDDTSHTLLDVGVFRRPAESTGLTEIDQAHLSGRAVVRNDKEKDLKESLSKLKDGDTEISVLSRLAQFTHLAGKYTEEQNYLERILQHDELSDLDAPIYAGAFVRRIDVLRKLGRNADAELATSQRQAVLAALGLAVENFSYPKPNAPAPKPIKVVVGRKMGNIAPYRKDMLIRIAEFWRPLESRSIQILLTLSGEGVLLDRSIVKSSGIAAMDDEAIAAVSKVRYAPLPLWYKGEQLQFKIELDKTDRLNHQSGATL